MSDTNILIVEPELELREALIEALSGSGLSCLAVDSTLSAIAALRKDNFNLVISEVQMDEMNGLALLEQLKKMQIEVPIILMTAHGNITDAVDAIKLGALDYLVKPIEHKVLINKVKRYINQNNKNENSLIEKDPASIRLSALAKRVAQSDATILISGESGSGKEELAKFIHLNSMRSDKTFVAINCAAIPENMLEATLFGYEKGAYTGAHQANPGKFELAQHGTLLLDEISEMDIGLQAKILRVLQEREVERLGGKKTIALDVRVIATTNRVLKEEVAQGRFREDLYYRLNVFPLKALSLRERKEDIIPLAKHFLGRHKSAQHVYKMLTKNAEKKLVEHSWPGNVRELDNIMQRAVILSAGEKIDETSLLFELEDDELFED